MNEAPNSLFAGLYFSQHYDVVEGRLWLGIADAMFKRQAGYFKPHEDCNGYQWLTNGHLMQYTVARPDFIQFDLLHDPLSSMVPSSLSRRYQPNAASGSWG